MIKKSHRPYWNEEFQFVVEEATLKEKIRFEVKSKKRNLFAYHFRKKVGSYTISPSSFLGGLFLCLFELKSSKFHYFYLGILGVR